MKQTGEHFQSRRFAGTIWTEKSDELAWFNFEVYPVDGERLIVLPMEKPFDRSGKSGLFFVGAKSLGQAAGFNGRHGRGFESLIMSFLVLPKLAKRLNTKKFKTGFTASVAFQDS
jgi:hypothetical protein